MKRVAVLLELLMVTLPHSHESCRKESSSWFNIYNTTVDIRTYRCFGGVGDDIYCEKYRNAKEAVVRPNASRYCPRLAADNGIEPKRVFCEFPGHVNLLEDTVILAPNSTCSYHQGHCNDTDFSNVAFWNYTDICKYTLQGYSDFFSVWRVRRNRTTFIESGRIGLFLEKTDKYCGVNVWRTNYEDIIVSKEKINHSTYLNYSEFRRNFKSISRELCQVNDKRTPKILIKPKVLRTWYIYQYPTDVTIYICLQNASCKGKGEIVSRNDSELLNRCGKFYDPSPQPNITLCRKTHKIDLQKDTVLGLSGCKYNEGLCKPLKMFWEYTNRCRNVKKVYEALEERCEGKRCVNQKNNHTKLVLNRKGKLCDENVWYTDQLDLVASEKELGFFQSKSLSLEDQNQEEDSWFLPKLSGLNSVKMLGGKEYYIIVPLAISVFWIVLKIAMCPIYFCSKCNSRKSSDFNEDIEPSRITSVLNLQQITVQNKTVLTVSEEIV